MESYDFRELKYIPNDYKALKEEIDSLEKCVIAAESFEELERAFSRYDSMMEEMNYEVTLTNIHQYLDASSEYWNKVSVEEIQEMTMLDSTSFLKAVKSSPFFPLLEKKYGNQLGLFLEKEIATGGAALEEKAKEEALVSSYQQKKALIKIKYNGEERSEGSMYSLFESPDRAVRISSKKAVYEAFLKEKEELGQLLLDLIAVRDRVAKENGFSNYLEYMDRIYGRTTYGEKELALFTDEVKKEIVPLCAEINEEKRVRLGLDKLMEYDLPLTFLDGNAKIAGGEEVLREASQKMYQELDPEMGEFFSAMVKSRSFDISASPNKIAGMGFCAALKRGLYPFVFGNLDGTETDIAVFTHEIGHSWQGWLSDKAIQLNVLRDMPLDAVEIPSETMELFVFPYAEYFFGEDADKYRFSHFCSVIEDIVAYCSIHDLNTWIYTHVGASFEEITDAWRRIEASYWPGIEKGELEQYCRMGAPLLRNMGVYMFPRYLISYAISHISAMDLFRIMNEDKEEALKKYNILCSQGGEKGYEEILASASLYPFYTPGKVKELADFARNYIRKGIKKD